MPETQGSRVMRVAIVLKTFHTARGGAESWTAEMVRWLVGQGHEVHVGCRKCDDVVPTLGARLHLLPTRSSWRFARKAERLLRELDVDVVHDMGCGWYFDVFHSHVGAGAYLSQMDLEYAEHEFFPFPDAAQIVLAVFDRKVKAVGIFERDGETGGFVGRALKAGSV